MTNIYNEPLPHYPWWSFCITCKAFISSISQRDVL